MADRYSDEDLLKIVGEERRRSIGFGEGDTGDLAAAREKALNYNKGVMNDVPSLLGRSGAVDMTIADAVATALPDLVEIFVGGDDVATFNPISEEDEERAREETEFVNHVVFTENPGTVFLASAIQDALLLRLGVLHWWFEEDEKSEMHGPMAPEMAAVMQMQMGQDKPWASIEPQQEEADETGAPGMISLKVAELHGKVKIRAVPPDDFTVAADTVILGDTTYCAMRDRPRVQDLIARGIDKEKARSLPRYTTQNEATQQARDESGESRQWNAEASAIDDLRTVEVRAHYIRLDMEDTGRLSIWLVVTDAEERVLLHKEEVSHIPFGPLTPYLVSHRLIGESVADKLFEIQRIKTALLRMWLDSGWFALNQRMEVDMSAANEFTIADLLRNEVGVPVRVARAGALKPLQAGQLGFDPPLALEYASTMAESRTGIVRNAQGLNPDTLHDTAKGAMALMTMAQKRLRLIARLFAEMGIKDMFLGVHRLLRECCTDGHAPSNAKLSRAWKSVKPSDWTERCAMTVHVGVGSAGRDQELIIANNRLQLMDDVVTLQGGLGGPLLDAKNAYAALMDWERAGGSKKGELFWSDPANAPPQEPKPDPEMAKVQSQMQLAQAQAASDVQLAQQKAATEAQTTAQKHQLDAEAAERQAQRDHELMLAKVQTEGELKRYQIDQELMLKREQLTAELQLKRELGLAQAAVGHEVGMAKVNASTSQVEPGGEAG